MIFVEITTTYAHRDDWNPVVWLHNPQHQVLMGSWWKHDSHLHKYSFLATSHTVVDLVSSAGKFNVDTAQFTNIPADFICQLTSINEYRNHVPVGVHLLILPNKSQISVHEGLIQSLCAVTALLVKSVIIQKSWKTNRFELRQMKWPFELTLSIKR